ncbi:MAG: VWA domain-containing protein [Planctomycetaceae bacterium]|nr:MAG: VWA domain-containing protein [Planctomycetaceae bacterium]
MLNKQSMPVWMLNDILGGLLGGGVIVSLASVTLLLPHIDTMLKAQKLDGDLTRAHDELGTIRDAYALISNQHDKAVEFGRLMKGEADRLEGELDQERKKAHRYASERAEELQIRRELIGLRGDFERTLIAIDISGSMAETPKQLPDPSQRPNWGPEESSWVHVRRQIDAWLRYLPVGSFRLICFNHELNEFPTVERMWLSGDQARQEASDYLAGLEPNGYTYTEQALERAAAWRPTTIILFTDGAPTNDQGKLDPDQQRRILQRVGAKDWQIPVNVIALNDYLTDGLGLFLQRLAGSTGGGFMGM